MIVESNGKRAWEGVKSIFNVVGGVGGLLAISIVIWKGGALYARDLQQETRLCVLEKEGSATLQSYIKVEEERYGFLRDRVKMLEAVLIILPDVKTDVAVLNVKMDAVQKTLDRIVPPK